MTFDIDPDLICMSPPPGWAIDRAKELLDHIALSQCDAAVAIARGLVLARCMGREDQSTAALRAFADRIAPTPQREAKAS